MKKLYKLWLIPFLGVTALSTAYGDSLGFTSDTGLKFEAVLSRAQEVQAVAPGNITESEIKVRFDEGFTQVEVELRVEGGDRVIAAHFHCALPGVNGPIAFGFFSPGPLAFDGREARGVLTNADFTGEDCEPLIGRPVNNIAALAFAMREGLIYANVHTEDNPAGEVRGQLLARTLEQFLGI